MPGGGNPYHDDIGRFTFGSGAKPSAGEVLAGGTGSGVDIIGSHGKTTHLSTSPEGASWIEKHRQQSRSKYAGSREHPIPCGNDIEKAARLIAAGKHITLNQVSQVSTLVRKIKRDADAAKAAGKTYPVFNIAAISVPGTNLFAQDNLDVPRIEMPQLGGRVLPGSKAHHTLSEAQQKNPKSEVDLTQKFLEGLRARGIKSTKEGAPGEKEVLASHLRATQGEIDGAKVAATVERMEAGKNNPRRITVTRDDYILDGHHGWAATIVRDLQDNHPGDLGIEVERLDIDIGTALTLARDFQEEWGIRSASMGAKQDFTTILHSTFDFRVYG